MWVYTKNALKERLRMPSSLGLWLDYWLFLLAEDTHPAWCARPLGMSAVARLAHQYTHSRYDKTIRRQLKAEVQSLLNQGLALAPSPRVPTALLNDDDWPKEWTQWFKSFLSSSSFQADLTKQLYGKLTEAINSNNEEAVLKWTSLLVNEITGQGRSRRELLQRAIGRCCSGYSDLSEDPKTVIAEVVFPEAERQFTVTVPLISPPVSGRVRRRIGRFPTTELIFGTSTADGEPLIGIGYQITTFHAEAAALEARTRTRMILERLRLRHYVMASVAGNLKVTEEPAGVVTDIPFQQPFWVPERSKRGVPRIPPHIARCTSAIEMADQPRWLASLWHLSEAMARWQEDVHSAAAEIWQALEAFGPERQQALERGLEVKYWYLTEVGGDLLDNMAHKFSLQCKVLHNLMQESGGESPWFYYDSTRWHGPEDWLSEVTNPSSGCFCGCWHDPEAPHLLFDSQYGKLYEVRELLCNKPPPNWVEERLDSDLRLLYGLRNAIIHKGDRTMSENLARYLGQVGLEVLLKALGAVHQKTLSCRTSAKRVSIDDVLEESKDLYQKGQVTPKKSETTGPIADFDTA